MQTAVVQYPVGTGIQPFITASTLAFEPSYPLIQRKLWIFFPGVKHPENEADLSPQSCAKFRNTWIFSSVLDVW
jgi:hypothetical protein